KVVDLVALAAEDRLAKQRRNLALAAARKAQGADTQPGWHPDSRTVQTAVQAGLAVDKHLPAESVARADVPEEPAAPITAGNGGDEDPAGYTEMVGRQGGLTAL